MIYWAPLLHFYQPPTQLHWVLRKVCNESYRPLVQLFHELPHAKMTVNINASLTELLAEHGMSDVIDGMRDLAEKGVLEFTGSAKYHPILPLIPQDECLRQIVHNYQTNRRYFGRSYSPQGFFSPEMCYSRDILTPVLETGHRWIILSGIACTVPWPTDIIDEVHIEGLKLSVFFRDDLLSNRISFKQTDAPSFIEQLRRLAGKGKDIYVITAMDAETFGHHIQHWDRFFLAEVYEALDVENGAATSKRQPAAPDPGLPPELTPPNDLAKKHGELLRTVEAAETGEIRVVTISELLDIFPAGRAVEPRPSSWSASIEDIQAGDPYPLWRAKDNQLHQLLWQHFRITMQMAKKALEVATSEDAKSYASLARGMLDRAMHSDQFWWASGRPWWNINLVNRGVTEQRGVILNAYKAIKLSDVSEDEKLEWYYRVIAARDLRSKVSDQLWAR